MIFDNIGHFSSGTKKAFQENDWIDMKKIYLDYNASTPIAREVADKMALYLKDHYGNPSSNHWASLPAAQALSAARSSVATLLRSNPEEVVFTSGGTESNNFVIKGCFYSRSNRNAHIITTQVEHPAVLAPCRFLQSLGAKVTYLPVDSTGMVDPDDVKNAISKDTILITVMHANNEVGTIQPIQEIGRMARERGILFHTDAAQSAGKIPTRVDDLNVDFLSIAGHKLYGPKGVGALFIRQGVHLEPLMHGAGHEAGRRAGTENVLLDVGLGAACEKGRDLPRSPSVEYLRDTFWEMLQSRFDQRVVRNGHPDHCLPNTLNVSFLNESGAMILDQLPGLAASTGSACHSGETVFSPVLKAMGASEVVCQGAIRFSLGYPTTEDEIVSVMDRLEDVLLKK